MSLIKLGDQAPRSAVGGKFASLSAIRELVPVPPAVCLTADEFEAALGAMHLERIAEVMVDMQATVGAFTLEDQERLVAVIADIRPTVDQRRMLRMAVSQDLEDFGNGLAVRSSAIDEDGEHASRAGLYDSVIGVQNWSQLWSAVSRCWRSYYGPAALSARLRSGDHDPTPRIAVIVQKLVVAEQSGVAFSNGPEEVLVERVQGGGDRLVSGVMVPERLVVTNGAGDETTASVAAAVERVRTAWARDVDMEWVWAADELHVVQARPVTARRADSRPFYETGRLYLDDVLPPGMQLGDIEEVYASYVSKRVASYRLATELGIPTGAAHVICTNGPGFSGEDGRRRFAALLASTSATEVVLDLGDRQRQIVVRKDDAHAQVQTLLGLTPSETTRRAFILRDFITGDYGAISRQIADGAVLVEASTEGLMKMNRGTTGSLSYVVRDGVIESVTPMPSELIAVIKPIEHFTKELGDHLGGAQLEWVVGNGFAYFVDFSRETSPPVISAHQDGTVIAPGVGRGPIMELGDDELLERLSIGPAVSVGSNDDAIAHSELKALITRLQSQPVKPVVYARRPYAVLAVIFDYVAGFIFADGSLLCHLAILLREDGLPGIIYPDPPVGKYVIISGGRLTVISPAEASP